jgi:outer membrane lipoprotein-sorting protein
MKTIILAICTICVLNTFAQSAQEISKKSMDAVEVGDMEMISTINIYDAKGNVRTRQISTASRKFADCTKMLIRFLAPADVKGTSLLVYDYNNQSDHQWIYMPALRKVRRILSTEKGKNFMGSEFTNADMGRPNLQDYTYTNLGVADIDGKKCWQIEAKCKNEDIQQENGFTKKISYIDQNTFVTYKIEYYDFGGQLQRVQTISDYKKQANNRYFAYHMTMQNVQNGRKSEMKVDKFQSGSKLPESMFSPSMLDK